MVGNISDPGRVSRPFMSSGVFLPCFQSAGEPSGFFFQSVPVKEGLKMFVSSPDMEPSVPMEFFETHGAKAQRPSVRLFQGVASVHHALVVDAVGHAKNVADFMGHYLATPSEGQGLGFVRNFLSPKTGKITGHAKNPNAFGRVGLAENEMPVGVRIQVGHGNRHEAYAILGKPFGQKFSEKKECLKLFDRFPPPGHILKTVPFLSGKTFHWFDPGGQIKPALSKLHRLMDDFLFDRGKWPNRQKCQYPSFSGCLVRMAGHIFLKGLARFMEMEQPFSWFWRTQPLKASIIEHQRIGHFRFLPSTVPDEPVRRCTSASGSP